MTSVNHCLGSTPLFQFSKKNQFSLQIFCYEHLKMLYKLFMEVLAELFLLNQIIDIITIYE